MLYLGDVSVCCNQTHRVMKVKAAKLSLEERDITEKDLAPGSHVLLEEDDNYYPVMVLGNDVKGRKRVTEISADTVQLGIKLISKIVILIVHAPHAIESPCNRVSNKRQCSQSL